MTERFLLIRALSLDGQPMSPPLQVRLGAAGGTIGRGIDNDLALPDPARVISRTQVRVDLRGDAFTVTNTGSANPVLLNGEPLHPGQSMRLGTGDDLRIGGYVLALTQETVATQAVLPDVTMMRAPVRGQAPPPQRLPDDFDPFADPAALALAGAGLHAARPSGPPPPGPGHPMAAPPQATPLAPAPLSSPQRAGDPLFDLVRPAAPGADSLDALFDLGPGVPAGGDPLAGLAASIPAPKGPPASLDPLDLINPPARPEPRLPMAPPAPPSVSNHVPEIVGAFVPPSPRQPAPASPPGAAVGLAPPVTPWGPPPGALPNSVTPPAAPSAAAAPGNAAYERDLVRAFCAGAGISLPGIDHLGTEQMRVIGELLAASINGMVQLMAVRATLKHEMRAEVTTIQARNNNPLKFSPDATVALTALLQPPVRGFLAGPVAVRDAANDLVAHTIGTMAGMRAALQSLLERYDPAALERQLGERSALDSLLPSHRKARLWELYVKHSAAIQTAAEDDFHAVFGQAFVAAYEQQIDRLDRDLPKDTPPGVPPA